MKQRINQVPQWLIIDMESLGRIGGPRLFGKQEPIKLGPFRIRNFPLHVWWYDNSPQTNGVSSFKVKRISVKDENSVRYRGYTQNSCLTVIETMVSDSQMGCLRNEYLGTV